ncbi:Naringenin 8-dimethylallyltransferase 2, chloroplastic, partial [Mucuna pruriens]
MSENFKEKLIMYVEEWNSPPFHIFFNANSCNNVQTFVFKKPAIFPRSLIFSMAFMSLYSIAIAFVKDIPDIEGDEKFGIQSLSVRLGQKRVFWICISLFEMAFGVAILAGATSPYLWTKIVTGLGHAVLASILWFRAKSTDYKSKASMSSFYMFIWKLLSVEYFLMPLLR